MEGHRACDVSLRNVLSVAMRGGGVSLISCLSLALAISPARADSGPQLFGAGATCADSSCKASVWRKTRNTPLPAAGAARSVRPRSSGGKVSEKPDLRTAHGIVGGRGAMAPMPVIPGRKKTAKPGRKSVPLEVVVQRAVADLQLPKPVPRTSPSENFTQVVHVPTWMWVERDGWGPVTKTAEVEGVKVTATATPRKAVWRMGDGQPVACDGPGTPYADQFGPESSSPDCGYTYRRASASAPDGKFRAEVTVTWDVAWRGAGQTGSAPGITMSTDLPLAVDEVQAVVSG